MAMPRVIKSLTLKHFFFFFMCYMSEHQKIFTFSFELEHILYVRSSKIVKSKDVLFDNNTEGITIELIEWETKTIEPIL